MALTLTNLYLDASQKMFLHQRAEAAGTNLSVEARRAIDACREGLSLEDLRLLDAATRQAAREIDAANAVLDHGLARAQSFFDDIARLKAAS